MAPRKSKKNEQAAVVVNTNEEPVVQSTVEEQAAEPVVTNTVIEPSEPQPTKQSKSKKTKKQVQVVALVTPEGIEGNFQPVEQRRSLIAHLHIHSNEVKFSDVTFQYDPNPPKQPEPYDGDGDDLYTNYTRAEFENNEAKVKAEVEEDLGKPVPIADPLGNPQAGPKTAGDDSTKPLQPFYRCNLMVKYKEANDFSKLPDSVDIACFWCTENFTNQPCVIPEREEASMYKVYGNFCCPECALSYLLQESLDSHVRWERMSLLHRLYSDLYPNRIFPAPPRDSLKKFGGPMTIEQYRNTLYSKQVRVDIQMPPLVSILGTMDTKPIDFYDSNTKGNAVTIHDRISKAEEGLRLRRNKPLKDKESTLDACMKISIKSGARA